MNFEEWSEENWNGTEEQCLAVVRYALAYDWSRVAPRQHEVWFYRQGLRPQKRGAVGLANLNLHSGK
ncbi:MAG: hypothetical protein OK454_08625, partial [Thaumarchaeota archaeon]|nr:hypothetical protein [Nitrososphaerota archaeon]